MAVDKAILTLKELDQPVVPEMLAEFGSARRRPMRNWRFVFMLAAVVAGYFLVGQHYLIPAISSSISGSASDVTFPSTDVGTAMHRNLLGN